LAKNPGINVQNRSAGGTQNQQQNRTAPTAGGAAVDLGSVADQAGAAMNPFADRATQHRTPTVTGSVGRQYNEIMGGASIGDVGSIPTANQVRDFRDANTPVH